jgi:hypothetical protein
MRWRSHAREFSDPSGRAAANVIRMGISFAARCVTTRLPCSFSEYVTPGSNVISLSISSRPRRQDAARGGLPHRTNLLNYTHE